MEPSPREQADLRSLIQALWRRRWLFLGVFVSIPVAVYVISNLVPKTYETEALVRLQAVNTDVAALTTPTTASVDTQALLIDTQKVEAEAARELYGPDSSRAFGEDVETEPLTTQSGSPTDLLLVVAQADSGERAAEVANAYARAMDTVRTERTLKDINQSMARLEAESGESDDPAALAELQRQLQLLRAARAEAESDTEIVQSATAPSIQLSPAPRRNTALAALVALLLALAAVAVRERFDRGLREPDELERLLGIPLLSVIPRAAFPGQRPSPTPVREAFRTLAASLVYFNVDRRLSTVLVASPTKGDGKTTVATNLAVALARDGQGVVLVDCDLRHPQVAIRLGVEPAAGLAEVLSQQAELEDALLQVDVGDGRLQVLAAGNPPPNAARLISSSRMGSLLEELTELADIVIVDTPPMLHVSDAVPLLERASGIVVVAKIGHTTRDALVRVRQVIETARGNLLGAVAAGAAGAGLYGYGGDYYADEARPEPEPAAAAPAVDGARTRGMKGPRPVQPQRRTPSRRK